MDGNNFNRFEPICFWRFPYYIFVTGGNREDKEFYMLT